MDAGSHKCIKFENYGWPLAVLYVFQKNLFQYFKINTILGVLKQNMFYEVIFM